MVDSLITLRLYSVRHFLLGVCCLYSPSCREEVFSETRIPPVAYPLYRTGAEREKSRSPKETRPCNSPMPLTGLTQLRLYPDLYVAPQGIRDGARLIGLVSCGI